MHGKVAIVTGASRGIGRAIAMGYAWEGSTVVVAAHSESTPSEQLTGDIHETVAEIEARGGRALAVRCDVTKEESVAAVVDETLAEFGRIDVLVNNAAVDFSNTIIEMPLQQWELVLQVGLTGPFLCSRAVLPTMIVQGGGSIINVSLPVGAQGGDEAAGHSAAYAVSKAAIDYFTRALAAEVGRHNIAVNTLKTLGLGKASMVDPRADQQRRRGWDSTDAMVECAVFLAKQVGSSVTGTVATDDEYIARHGLSLVKRT